MTPRAHQLIICISAALVAVTLVAPVSGCASGGGRRMAPARGVAAAPAPPASPALDDATFLRRVTLDLAGRVPTLDEAAVFAADGGADRRARLVDGLLAGEDSARHFAAVYADLLVGREARLRGPLARRGAGVGGPMAWLVAAFADNRPWDQVTRDLLTAEGALADNPAAFYAVSYAQRGSDAAAAAGATARVFLGVSIECAQCHDHPYDKSIKQEDFTRFAAFFARTRVRRDPGGDGAGGRPRLVVEELRGPTDPRRAARVEERARARAAAKGRELPAWAFVEPRFLGQDVVVAYADGETRRQALAREIVAAPEFPRATVTRLWGELVGAGTPPAALAEGFRAGGFDHRALLRAIVLSEGYAAGPVRALSADQIFASLLAATGVEAMGRGRFRAAVERGRERALREYLFVFADDEGAEVGAFTGSVPQALLLWNGEVLDLGTGAHEGGTLARALGAPDDAARLDVLFAAAYARRATAAEAAPLLAHVHAGGGRDAAWSDVFFALLVSTEFLTNH